VKFEMGVKAVSKHMESIYTDPGRSHVPFFSGRGSQTGFRLDLTGLSYRWCFRGLFHGQFLAGFAPLGGHRSFSSAGLLILLVLFLGLSQRSLPLTGHRCGIGSTCHRTLNRTQHTKVADLANNGILIGYMLLQGIGATLAQNIVHGDLAKGLQGGL